MLFTIIWRTRHDSCNLFSDTRDLRETGQTRLRYRRPVSLGDVRRPLLCRLTGAPLLWRVFIITKNSRKHKGFLQVKIDPSELVSQVQAAKMRGISFQAIQYLIKQGRFTVVAIGGKKFLFRKEVEAFEPRP